VDPRAPHLELGDVRGELLRLESELAELAPADARREVLVARALELQPKAERAWRREIEKKHRFRVERGLPVLELELRAKSAPKLVDAWWLVALRITAGVLRRFDKAPVVDRAIASILAQPGFARVRALTAAPIPMTWEGLIGFCACAEVRSLETLDLDLMMQPGALVAVLGSTHFESLTELTLAARSLYDIPRQSFARAPTPEAYRSGFDRVDGLPALRRLHLGEGIPPEPLRQLLRSPLVRRVESLRVIEHGALASLQGASLPKLRSLAVHGLITAPITTEGMKAIAANPSLRSLESLDLSDATFEGEALRPLLEDGSLPSLRRLDIRHRYRYQRTELLRGGTLASFVEPPPRRVPADILDPLRARFSDRLLAEGEPTPVKRAKRR